jgi:hypothetical protein
MALASILQSCGSADTIAILEEPKAVLGDQNKNWPLLSRVKAERIALLGKNLSLDFNNEKTGTDEGMKYSCVFDSVIDAAVEKGREGLKT